MRPHSWDTLGKMMRRLCTLVLNRANRMRFELLTSCGRFATAVCSDMVGPI